MCVYLFAPSRGQPLFLFVNKQLCYSRQNKNFTVILQFFKKKVEFSFEIVDLMHAGLYYKKVVITEIILIRHIVEEIFSTESTFQHLILKSFSNACEVIPRDVWKYIKSSLRNYCHLIGLERTNHTIPGSHAFSFFTFTFLF